MSYVDESSLRYCMAYCTEKSSKKRFVGRGAAVRVPYLFVSSKQKGAMHAS
jgi:hypothetical protein